VNVSSGCPMLRREMKEQCILDKFEVDIENYGIDWEGPSPSEEWGGPLGSADESVVIPETSLPLSLETYEELARTIDPCQYSEFQGVDIYM